MPLVEQLCDGDLLIGALDRLGEHGRDGQVLDAGLGQLRFADGSGNGIEQGQLLDAARLKALKRGCSQSKALLQKLQLSGEILRVEVLSL